ncbi:topoisomerase DNA-binding C4 zinc finger domain-containing protein [Lactococcus lactis]|uniref:topoisomerase DNA-binding C4 zinc finger domain-containing protein n=1 Tax=Lactococcus lactis TaxID=1358 RepID=UPI0024A9D7AA|nr:topoisomerase DNA-binding C4 zinc finger domain-containing protein [Lactococcus lactis]
MNLFTMFKKKKSNVKTTTEVCPRCHSSLTLREGKYGKFWGCDNFPKCGGTLPYDRYMSEQELADDSAKREEPQQVEIDKFINIVSGYCLCPHCNKRTLVTGLGLRFDETYFEEGFNLKDWGYDILFFSWSAILPEQEEIEKHLLLKYKTVWKRGKKKIYYTHTCEHCYQKINNGYIYDDLTHVTPFGVHSKEKLYLERIALDKPLRLKITIRGSIAPTTQFLKRIEYIK